MGRISGFVVAALCLTCVAQASAATQRFASPSGTGTTCTSAVPCSITEAIDNAGNGDEVIVNPGTYGSPTPIATDLFVAASIDVHGVAGQPRPVIISSSSIPLDLVFNSTLRHVEIIGTAPSNGGALRFDGTLAEDFIATGMQQHGCEAHASAILRDGVCQSTGPNNTFGLFASANGAAIGQITLRNMTILSASNRGLNLISGAGRPAALSAVNSIIRGGGGLSDIDVFSGGDANASVTVSHDNFATTNASVQTATTGVASIADDGTSQSPPPLLSSDFHELAGSPTIDAGFGDPLNGPTDIDGDARALGASTDIGADELVPPAITPAVAGAAVATPPRKCHKKKKRHKATSAKKRHGCKKKKKRH